MRKGRPEVLFPLFSDLESLPGIGPKSVVNYARLGIERPVDLLFTLPLGVIDRRLRASVREATLPEVVTVEVRVGEHIPARSRGKPYRVVVADAAESFHLVFFHARGDYIRRLLPTGQVRVISGKAEFFDGMTQMTHPEYVVPPSEASDIPAFEPVYPLTEGINRKQMVKSVAGALARLPEVGEWADPAQVAREAWPPWTEALRSAHAPRLAEDLGPETKARQRLAYDEFFAHQLTLGLARSRNRARAGQVTSGDGGLRRRVLAALPYAPTGAQERAMAEIAGDLAAPERMMRLLQGDVGSGKTLVAFQALLVAVEAGGQGVMMAPTEVLARQHFEGLSPLAAQAGVRLEILTGRDKGAARRVKLEALAAGEIDILTGTHAVFQKGINFCSLRLAVVDEQHRFGVQQRLDLAEKGAGVDVLLMTATPIPRSLSLVQYGDMDVSVLDEKPPGRQPIATVLVNQDRESEVIEHLKNAIGKGQQAYWVCPLVEESEQLDLTAAADRFKALRGALGEGVAGLVHGQMSPEEKDRAMADFVAGRTRVLVATTVIEVGVDVPNASIMVIERAESFGLAQLHQLRGRVGRGTSASSCLLMFQSPLSSTGEKRLKTMRESNDGFHISEVDLQMRGAGDVLGHAQSGMPRFRIANPENQTGLMATARQDARKLLQEDPGLTSPRGRDVRTLLWLLQQDQAIQLVSVG